MTFFESCRRIQELEDMAAVPNQSREYYEEVYAKLDEANERHAVILHETLYGKAA